MKYSNTCVYHQYVILTKYRKKLINLFKKEKNSLWLSLPICLKSNTCFENFFKNQKYPNAEKIASQGISLPIDPNLRNKDLRKIVKVINSFLKKI